MQHDLIGDSVAARTSDCSDPIQDFYTRHPYPPPVDNLDRARDEWRDQARHRAEFHLLWPDRPFRSDLDILVAGCGTWQAAKYAVCRPDARVVGIDVSLTSIEHTMRLKQQYSLANLEVRQLPVEQAGDLDRDFDLVVCTGVLHHLANPDAGLGALRSILRPNGVMYLMVYAPYGRAGIYLIQEYCRRLGIGTTDQDLRELVAALQALPQNHPLTSALRRARDARNADALADALLNPRDRSYSVPQLYDFLERNGLTLQRWYWQAPYLWQCGAPATTPHARRIAALPDRDRYAAAELWRGTMTAHSAIVRRSDAQPADASVRFDGDAWPAYVPLRLPWTELVQERLPSGAAAVLLNRSHPFNDLILTVDAEDKRLVEGIDGRRRIDQIVEREPRADRGRAKVLFERLWQYDQVAFDASAAR
jgi:SAM-dependent methyltransferase